jgi:hypothetical protein
MWTKGRRKRQAALERRRRCPTDLTDTEWEGNPPGNQGIGR